MPKQLQSISKLIQDHVFAFRDSTDEKFIPIYQIISKDNIESAGLTECELLLLKAFTKESATINLLFGKLLTWYQQEKFPLRRARFVDKKELFY